MITRQDLEQAIAECKGEKNPNANTCIKLAAFITIKRELYGEEKEAAQLPSYSYAPAPIRNTIEIYSGTEFARAIDGMEQTEVMPVIDELMETLKIVYPSLYRAVIGKLEG